MERPLLVTTSLIKPIQERRKTETRRLNGLEEINENPDEWNFNYFHDTQLKGRLIAVFNVKGSGILKYPICPYGQPGGELWIRENWFVDKSLDKVKPSLLPVAFNFGYVADGNNPEWKGRTRPSIHMLRDCSRISLKIQDIQVERLHDIKREGVIAEGVGREVRQMWLFGLDSKGIDEVYRRSFKRLWISINGESSWNVNPWVWVIKFSKK